MKGFVIYLSESRVDLLACNAVTG